MQVAVVVYPGMTALDAIGPYELLHGIPGWDLRLVYEEVGPVMTDSKVLALGATHGYDETPHPDLVLVPGSSCRTAHMMLEGPLLQWLREVHPTTRFTTSVCSGALILAAAGLLKGVPATTHWAAMPFLSQFGAEARPNQRVVRHGKIWTAAGVSAGIDLALALIGEIEGEAMAKEAQLLIEYDPQPPFDSGHMSKADAATKLRARARMAKLAASDPSELLAFPRAIVQRWKRALQR